MYKMLFTFQLQDGDKLSSTQTKQDSCILPVNAHVLISNLAQKKDSLSKFLTFTCFLFDVKQLRYFQCCIFYVSHLSQDWNIRGLSTLNIRNAESRKKHEY